MQRQMRQIATKILSHVAIGARDNAIALQESPPQAFIAFFLFAVLGYLRSQANLVAIQRKPCIMREKNDAMHVSMSYV